MLVAGVAVGAALLLIVAAVAARVTIFRPAPTVHSALGAATAFEDAYPYYAPLDARDVTEKWSEVLPGEGQGATIDGDRLYLLYDKSDASELTAFDLTNGERLWTRDLSSRYTGHLLIDGSHLVLVGSVRDKPSADPSATVAAWQTGDGERVWGPIDLDGTAATAVSPVGDGRIIVTSPRKDGRGSTVQALDLGSGSTRWTTESTGGTAVAGPHNVYTLDGRDIVAHRADSGEKAFTISDAGEVRIVEVGDVVAVARRADAGQVQAYDVGSGKKRWDEDVRSDDIVGLGRLDDTSLLVASSSRFVVVDTGSGAERWTSSALGSATFVTTNPGRLIGTSDGKVLELSLDKGQELANVRVKGDLDLLIPADGVVYLYDSGAQRVVGYDVSSGERLWTWAPPKGGKVAVLPVDRGALVFSGDRLTRLG